MADLSDRANPIVIQELRRGLRTRSFSVFFTFLLAACMVIALIAWVMAADGQKNLGRGFFIAFYVCLAIPCFFVIPYNAFRSLSRDREARHWALLVLTGLPPRKILGGKVVSALLQALLFASAAGPFLMFAYLLQGVDLATIALVGLATLGWELFLVVVATAAATLAESNVWRALVHFLVIAFLLWETTSATSLISVGLGIGRSTMFTSWREVLAVLMVPLSYAALAFAVAVSRLTFSADNTAFWPRIMLLVQALLAGAAAFIDHSRSTLVVYGVLGAIQTTLVGTFLAGAEDGLSRRLRLARPRLSLFGLLLPGAVRGFRFFVLLTAVVAGIALVRQEAEGTIIVIGAAAFSLLYVATGIALARGPLQRLLPTPLHVRAFCLFLVAVGCLTPLLISTVLTGQPLDAGINLLNPAVSLPRWADHPSDADGLVVIAALALAATVLAERILAARDAEAIAADPLPAVPLAPAPGGATGG